MYQYFKLHRRLRRDGVGTIGIATIYGINVETQKLLNYVMLFLSRVSRTD